MEGLRPERDELDRFQKRADTSGKPKQAKKRNKPSSTSQAASMPLVVGLFVMSLVLFVALGWAYLKQNEALTAVTKKLDDAEGFINQSQLLMARFEGELSEAGAELEQSGSAAERKLKFLDSEMRKLWGLAGDKNRKAISGNNDAISGLQVQLKQIKDQQLASLNAALLEQKTLSAGLQRDIDALSAVNAKQVSLEKQFAATANEVSFVRESFEEGLERLSKQIASTPDASEAVTKNAALSKENSKAIESIDASRRQLNTRIVNLERRLNELKLAVAASAASKAPSASQN